MRVLVSIVGERSEHWLSLFEALAELPGQQLTVIAADITPATASALEQLAATHRQVQFVHGAHLLGERFTGHMASTFYDPRCFAALPAEVDLVHVIGEASYPTTRQLLALAARRYPNAPVTLYGAQNVLQRFPWPFRAFERHALATAAHAFPVSQDALDVLRAKGYKGPATVLPLGVDTRRFTPGEAAGGAFTVGFVGRLEPHKGVEQLIDAAARLRCRLALVGDGSMRAALAERARALGVQAEFSGWITHERLPQLIRSMDVLALPSVEVVQQRIPFVKVRLREQFGRVLCEAMACGVPVVGARLGEIPRVIGDAGLTFAPGSVDQLCEALITLRGDPELRAQLGRRGRERAVELYEWRTIARRLSDSWNATRAIAIARAGNNTGPAAPGGGPQIKTPISPLRLKFSRFVPKLRIWSSPTT